MQHRLDLRGILLQGARRHHADVQAHYRQRAAADKAQGAALFQQRDNEIQRARVHRPDVFRQG